MTKELRGPSASSRMCYVNCGKPSHQCECLRGQLLEVFRDIASGQTHLGAEFEKAWANNVEELYEP